MDAQGGRRYRWSIVLRATVIASAKLTSDNRRAGGWWHFDAGLFFFRLAINSRMPRDSTSRGAFLPYGAEILLKTAKSASIPLRVVVERPY